MGRGWEGLCKQAFLSIGFRCVPWDPGSAALAKRAFSVVKVAAVSAISLAAVLAQQLPNVLIMISPMLICFASEYLPIGVLVANLSYTFAHGFFLYASY